MYHITVIVSMVLQGLPTVALDFVDGLLDIVRAGVPLRLPLSGLLLRNLHK